MRLLAILCAAICLSGCAQKLISGNEAGGMVSAGDNLLESRAGALQIADQHCSRFGKVARVSGEDPFAGTLSFDCVKP